MRRRAETMFGVVSRHRGDNEIQALTTRGRHHGARDGRFQHAHACCGAIATSAAASAWRGDALNAHLTNTALLSAPRHYPLPLRNTLPSLPSFLCLSQNV